MSSASWAMVVLLVAGVFGMLGLWQLLAGTSRRAELAARGRATGMDGGGRSLIRALDVRLRRTKSGQRLASWLMGAGVKFTPVELIGLMLAGGLGGLVVLSFLFTPVIAFFAAVIGTVMITRGLIERRRGNRRDAFVAQLPEVARMLSNGASAGLSMQQAVRMASRELADPAGAELKRVVEETQVGRPIEDALEALRERLPSREVAVLMTTIAIQQRAGGDTVRALGELAATLEARKDLRREIKTLLSGVVFTSYVVAGIGGATILMINAISPGVTQEMTGSALGLTGLIVALILWTIAFVLVRRTTKIDV
jgi:tight adherence protein B